MEASSLIHWDLLAVSVPTAIRLLNRLRLLASWDCTCAPTEIFDAWNVRDWNALKPEMLGVPK